MVLLWMKSEKVCSICFLNTKTLFKQWNKSKIRAKYQWKSPNFSCFDRLCFFLRLMIPRFFYQIRHWRIWPHGTKLNVLYCFFLQKYLFRSFKSCNNAAFSLKQYVNSRAASRNKSPMPTGSSFYLVHIFKVAGGNGFRDTLSWLSQRTIRDTQVASLSLSFLARCVTTFFQPPARTVTTKLQLLLIFLLLCQSRLARICMSATFVLL